MAALDDSADAATNPAAAAAVYATSFRSRFIFATFSQVRGPIAALSVAPSVDETRKTSPPALTRVKYPWRGGSQFNSVANRLRLPAPRRDLKPDRDDGEPGQDVRDARDVCDRRFGPAPVGHV